MKKISMKEAMSMGMCVYTNCPKCKKEIKVKEDDVTDDTFEASCEDCKMTFKYSLKNN